MQNDHETILAALFTLIVNSVVVNFTGTATQGSPTLTALSSVNNFITGIPVFGPGIPQGATILSFDPVALTATLTQNATATSIPATAFNTGFQASGRRVVPWVKQTLFPALFLRHTEDEDQYMQTVLQRTEITAEIWIYSKAGENPDAVPDTLLNYLTTAVRNSLASDRRGYPQSLGGLVQWARIEGTSLYDPGDLDEIGKALIPVKILCP